MSWQDLAACRDIPKVVFYPPEGAGQRMYDEARRICAGCDVRVQCLSMALELEGPGPEPHRHGMFGGLTPRERVGLVPHRCIVCDAEHEAPNGRQTCSESCRRIWVARYQRKWLDDRRSTDPRPRAHGSDTRVNEGCRCSPCRNHRRLRGLEARMRARVRATVELEAIAS